MKKAFTLIELPGVIAVLRMNMKKKYGFTLIELLVVIAIIAVLMGILMPALRRVREQARMTKCTANMKHWGTFFHIRASENDGTLFRGAGGKGFWWVSELEQKDWDWTQNKTWFCPTATKPVQDEFGNTIGSFNINNAWGIFMDGADPDGGRKDFGPYGVSGSYGLNGYLINIPSNSVFGATSGVPAKEGWRNFNAIKQAAKIPMFTDALRFDLWPLPNQAPADNETEAWSNNSMSRTCINRHQGFVCTAFADGSARKVGLKELYVLNWHRSFDTSGPYTLAGGVTADKWPEWIRRYPDY